MTGAGSCGTSGACRAPRCTQQPKHTHVPRAAAQEERQRGYFDEAGNYVEKEDKEEAEATDAWLQSDEGGWGKSLGVGLGRAGAADAWLQSEEGGFKSIWTELGCRARDGGGS